jgi:hypothetical protein
MVGPRLEKRSLKKKKERKEGRVGERERDRKMEGRKGEKKEGRNSQSF